MSDAFFDNIVQLRKLLIEDTENRNKPFLKLDGKYYHEYTGIIDKEKFTAYPGNPKILVSDLGRIKYNNKVIPQEIITNGKYCYLNVCIPGYGYLMSVHKMVAETHLKKGIDDPEWYYIVHHKSGNTFDNRVENLIYVSCVEHTLIHNYNIHICNNSKKYWEKKNIGCPKDCCFYDQFYYEP